MKKVKIKTVYTLNGRMSSVGSFSLNMYCERVKFTSNSNNIFGDFHGPTFAFFTIDRSASEFVSYFKKNYKDN
jgi:hypothetical protein